MHKLRHRGDAASALRLLGRARDKLADPAPGSPLARLADQIDAARAAVARRQREPADEGMAGCVPAIEDALTPWAV